MNEYEKYIQENAMSIFFEKVDLEDKLYAFRLLATRNNSLLKDAIDAIKNDADDVAIEFVSRVVDSFEKLLMETAFYSGQKGS